jgi:predicted site-specific integrase-resolvase
MIGNKITVKEAAQLIKKPISIKTVHKMIKDGRIKTAVRIASIWLIDQSEVEDIAKTFQDGRGNPGIKTLRRKTLRKGKGRK